MQHFIDILEESVRRNGEKPLTNKWLLNILKMADRKENEDEGYTDEELRKMTFLDWANKD